MPWMRPLWALLISIHAPREGGDIHSTRSGPPVCISIHAPREGGDTITDIDLRILLDISIHAPREGGD